MPQRPKYTLDARAAELKEKLLRSRGQNSGGREAPPKAGQSTLQEPVSFTANDVDALIKSYSATIPNTTNSEANTQDKLANRKDNGPSQPTTPSTPATSNRLHPLQPATPRKNHSLQKTSPERNNLHSLQQTTPGQNEIPSSQVEYSAEKGEAHSLTPCSAHQPQYKSREVPKGTSEKITPSSAPTGKAFNSLQTGNASTFHPSRNLSIKGVASAPHPIVPLDSLAQLIARDSDLRDWLNMTKYFEATYRAERLDIYRNKLKLKEVQAEITAKEERLREMELDMGLRPTSMTTNAAKAATAIGSAPKSAIKCPAKKPQSQSSPRRRSPVVSGPRFPGDRGYKRRDYGNQEPRNHRPSSRGSSRSHYLSSPDNHSYRQDPPARSREYSPHRTLRHNEVDFDDRRHRHDRYRSRSPSIHHSVYPRPTHVDLGNKGDTRFFIVKSFNKGNVDDCMKHGIWATQSHNVNLLTGAYKNCRNVILLFSINESKAFQGFARMTSVPSPDITKPRWYNKTTFQSSDPFCVEWLSKIQVDFRRVGHIKNSLNEHAPVIIGRDGQEIEEGAGRKLLGEMYAVADEKSARRDRPGGGGRGRSPVHRERHIKREDEMDQRW